MVRGLYKTPSMNDSKHLNDRETREGWECSELVCVCGTLADSFVAFAE